MQLDRIHTSSDGFRRKVLPGQIILAGHASMEKRNIGTRSTLEIAVFCFLDMISRTRINSPRFLLLRAAKHVLNEINNPR